MTNSPKPKAPTRAKVQTEKKPPTVKLLAYLCEFLDGQVVEVRGVDEYDANKVCFDKFGSYPLTVKKKPFAQPLHLTQRIQDDGLKSLRKKLEKQGKN